MVAPSDDATDGLDPFKYCGGEHLGMGTIHQSPARKRPTPPAHDQAGRKISHMAGVLRARQVVPAWGCVATLCPASAHGHTVENALCHSIRVRGGTARLLAGLHRAARYGWPVYRRGRPDRRQVASKGPSEGTRGTTVGPHDGRILLDWDRGYDRRPALLEFPDAAGPTGYLYIASIAHDPDVARARAGIVHPQRPRMSTKSYVLSPHAPRRL